MATTVLRRPRLLALTALLSVGCAGATLPPVDLGTGVRFVSEVADGLSDAGRHSDIVLTPEGAPLIAYFAFPDDLDEGEVAAPRPIGSPSVPGVLLTTVDASGLWVHGAIVIGADIPNVDLPFNPAIDEEAADIQRGSTTGISMVLGDDGRLHVAWGTSDGLWYAVGSSDPASMSQWEVERIGSSPPGGPSIALAGSSPFISYISGAELYVAQPTADGWSSSAVASAAACDAQSPCGTGAVSSGGVPAVAYTAADGSLSLARAVTPTWASQRVATAGELPDAAAMPGGGIAISYYSASEVLVAILEGDGPVIPSTVAAVDATSAGAEGAATSIAVDGGGRVAVAWYDASTLSVALAESVDGSSYASVETAGIRSAADPAVAIGADPAQTAVVWYDVERSDLMVGRHADLADLTIALASPIPQPKPVGDGSVPTVPSDCVDAVDGRVTVVAVGVAFTDGSCIRVAADEAFVIDFDNQDPAATAGQHNIAIFPSATALSDVLFRGDLISGPATAEYEVPALAAGQYYFHCDVHPQMTGQVVVEAGAGGGAGAGDGDGGGDAGGATSSTIVAVGLMFDLVEIFLAAGKEQTLTMDNQDAGVPHNVSIYPSASQLMDPLYRGELFTGPGTIDYLLPALDAGTYYFMCDVHPTMAGTVTVA